MLLESMTNEEFLSTPPVWVATSEVSENQQPHEGFYPRHPCGWRLRNEKYTGTYVWFLSTPPVWVATDLDAAAAGPVYVSIHATRVGGDATLRSTFPVMPGFYPRHPCGWRPLSLYIIRREVLFLSTPPVWVATGLHFLPCCPARCFYPRHPCGWRQVSDNIIGSILRFLSTPPVWVATKIHK